MTDVRLSESTLRSKRLTKVVQGIEHSEDIQAILDSLLGKIVDSVITYHRLLASTPNGSAGRLTDSWCIQLR